MGPATFSILFIVGLMVILGVLIMNSGAKRARAAARRADAPCGHPNEPGAQFCSRCGEKLPDEET